MRLQNRMSEYVPDDGRQAAAKATWSTHVVVPVTQNLIGGVAVGVLVWFGLRLLMVVPAPVILDWSAMSALVSAAFVSLVRFFGDDFGLFPAAYRAGRLASRRQIDALTAENQRLRAQLQATRGISATDDKDARAYGDAKRLLELAHTNGVGSITRAKVANWCPQRSWEKAIGMMRSSGALTDQDRLAKPTLAGSYELMDKYWQIRQGQGKSYVSAR